MGDIYINSNHSQNSAAVEAQVWRNPPMEHLSNDHEDHLSKNEHLFLSLKESQWKLRQQHGSEFQEGEKSTV